MFIPCGESTSLGCRSTSISLSASGIRGRYVQRFERSSKRNGPHRYQPRSIRTVIGKATPLVSSGRNGSNITSKVHRCVLRNSLIRRASFVRSLDFACVTDTLQHSTCRKFPTSIGQGSIGPCTSDGAAIATSEP